MKNEIGFHIAWKQIDFGYACPGFHKFVSCNYVMMSLFSLWHKVTKALDLIRLMVT